MDEFTGGDYEAAMTYWGVIRIVVRRQQVVA